MRLEFRSKSKGLEAQYRAGLCKVGAMPLGTESKGSRIELSGSGVSTVVTWEPLKHGLVGRARAAVGDAEH